MQFGLTSTNSYKVISTLSLAALTVDLFILYKLFYGLDSNNALIHDAMSLFLKLAVGLLTFFANKEQVLDGSIPKYENNFNGTLVGQLHAVACLLRLCTILVSHKRHIACRCVTILSCLCSLVYIFERAHPLYRCLYKSTSASVQLLPDSNRLRDWSGTTASAVKTLFQDYVCSRLNVYNEVSVLALVKLVSNFIFSSDTAYTRWILFGCDVVITIASCGCLFLKRPLISLPVERRFLSAQVIRTMALIGLALSGPHFDSFDGFDTLHLSANFLATFMAYVAQTETSFYMPLPTKQRKDVSLSSRCYVEYALILVSGLGILAANLNQGRITTLVKCIYACANVGLCLLVVAYRDYQFPSVNYEDLEQIEQMGVNLSLPLSGS